MSEYYRPRQPLREPSSHVSPSRDQQTGQRLLEIDLPEDSIYIFPNPSSSAGSAPSSPSLRSDISVPTDFTLSSESRSRHTSDHDGFRQTRSGHGRTPVNIRRRLSVGTDGNPELEIWDWNVDVDSVTVESAVDIEDVDQLQRWKFLTPQRGRVSTSSLWRARQQRLDSVTKRIPSVPRNTHRRYRSVDPDPGPTIPYHHQRIRMLSFIASLLFVDESTIRLLTHSSSQSALFPEHLICDEYPPEEQDGTQRGAIKPFSGLEGTRALREGIAVACDTEFASSNPFAPPNLRLSGLWGLVNGVWINGGRVLREIWT